MSGIKTKHKQWVRELANGSVMPLAIICNRKAKICLREEDSAKSQDKLVRYDSKSYEHLPSLREAIAMEHDSGRSTMAM